MDFLNKHRKIILFLIILLGFSLRFYAATNIHITWDEENDFISAQTIDFNYRDLKLSLVDKISPKPENCPMAFKYIIKLGWIIFGNSLLGARLPFVILGTLTIIIVYFLVRQALGNGVAFLASFLLSISQFDIAITRTANYDPLHMFFVLISLFLFYRAVQNHDKKLMFLNGLVIGLGFWVKESMVLLVPIYFVSLWFSYNNRWWLKNKYFWFSLGLSFLVVLPLLIANISNNVPRLQYISSAVSIGLSLNGIGLYLGELIVLGIKWITSTGISDYLMEGLHYKPIGWIQGSATFFDHVADTLTREFPPVNFLLGVVILVAVAKSIRKKFFLIRLLLICFLFNFLLFCFLRKGDVIDGTWSLGSLEWGIMGFIPGLILASNMLVGYIRKSRVKGSIFLCLLTIFIFIKTYDMVNYPLACYFPTRDFCIEQQVYGESERFFWSGKVDLAKQTLRKVYQVTDNNRYKTDAALKLAKILFNEGKSREANMYLYEILSDDPENKKVLELLERAR